MVIRSLALSILFVAVSAETSACECLWGGPFTAVQGSSDLVISGEVIRGKGNSVDISVEEVLRGTEYSPDIRIWLKTGELCRPDRETFPSGSRWVMALHRIEEDVPDGFDPGTPNVSYGRIGDYALSSCGGYYLSLTENFVSGNLADGTRWDMTPKMTPVIIDLVTNFVRGEVDADAVLSASRQDPAVREMMLNTKNFIREERYGIDREEDTETGSETNPKSE